MNMMAPFTNAARRLETMFPGFFQTTTKRNHYVDFGFPEQLEFNHTYAMFLRNGVARAAIDKTILKSWQSMPIIQEDNDAAELTAVEQNLAGRLSSLRFWQNVLEVDRRALVGGYSGLIFRFGDSKEMNQPVEPMASGLNGLVEIIPAWAGQLKVSEWDTDSSSDNYGKPSMYSFKELSMSREFNMTRQFDVHPDRVYIWSRDGSVHCESFLAAGYNDLVTLEKIIGAGGEGFWKNAKSAPILQVDKDAQLSSMAQAMGVPQDELADKMDKQVEEWQRGFDSLLMLQGMEAKTLPVTLPQPEEFVNNALQSFAASIMMPIKILVGMQTGERASKEDAKEWAQSNMARRTNFIIPNIMDIIERLVGFGIIPAASWGLTWDDLTESSMSEKIGRAEKMAEINAKQSQSGSVEPTFLDDEIRNVMGMAPLDVVEES